MATVTCCDACRMRLVDVEVASAYFAAGAIALNHGTEAHFIGSERPREFILCPDCVHYLDRCIDAIVDASEQVDAP